MSIYSDDGSESFFDIDPPCAKPVYNVVPNKLRIIVVYNAPWGPVPGAGPNPAATHPNQAPAAAQVPVSAGLPWQTQLVARPLTLGTPLERRLNPVASSATVAPGWDAVYNVPEAVALKYKTALKKATSFTFDFGRFWTSSASAKLTAFSQAGKASAEISFTYAWHQRRGKSQVTFSIDKCLASNARFTLLSAIDEFTPIEGSTEPFVPIIVLGLQQWTLSGGDWEDVGVADTRGDFYPVCCRDSGINLMTLKSFSNPIPVTRRN